MNIDAWAEAIEPVDLLFPDLSSDRHDRMVWVDLLYLTSEIFDLSINGGVGRFFESFHFVSEPPKKEGWVIFVFFNSREEALGLVHIRVPISVAETMAFVAQPEAEGYFDSFGMGIIENGLGVFIDTPSSYRISAACLKFS